MKRFDKKGMMIYPSPIRKTIREKDKVLVVRECYCPQGHNLINPRATFNGLAGIDLKVHRKKRSGRVVLSPMVGDKSRIALDVDLPSGEVVKITCPQCDTPLPIYADCQCGGELIALFTTPAQDYSHCVGICNRVDCFNGEVKSGEDLMSFSMLEAL